LDCRTTKMATTMTQASLNWSRCSRDQKPTLAWLLSRVTNSAQNRAQQGRLLGRRLLLLRNEKESDKDVEQEDEPVGG